MKTTYTKKNDRKIKREKQDKNEEAKLMKITMQTKMKRKDREKERPEEAAKMQKESRLKRR